METVYACLWLIAAFGVLLGPLFLLLFIDSLRLRISGRNSFRVPTFPASSEYSFYLAERRWRMGASDIAANEFLKQLVATRAKAKSEGVAPRNLIACRADFRRILSADTTAGLLQSLQSDSDEEQRIALWLLGRAHDRSVVSAVHLFSSARPKSLRREAVRALRRLEAWAELREIAKFDFDEQIRRIATPRESRDFSSRLSQFTGGVQTLAVEAPRPEFRLLTNLNPVGSGRPKSTDWIARLLRHIHFLVRGHA
jgi:hypothetical protein